MRLYTPKGSERFNPVYTRPMSKPAQALRPEKFADPEFVVRQLQSHGIAPTAQRIKVGELMFGVAQHATAEQVLEGLRVSGARISKATVYNTLNLFASHGLLKQINVDPERAYFDSNTGTHYHFHNLDTGELTDVQVPQIQFQCLPDPPEGMEFAGVDVVVRLRRKPA